MNKPPMQRCRTCDGKGRVWRDKYPGHIGPAIDVNCPECKGTGETGPIDEWRNRDGRDPD